MAYGSSIRRVDKSKRTRILTQAAVGRCRRMNNYLDSFELNMAVNTDYEVSMTKKEVTVQHPYQIGWFILSHSKWLLIEFVHLFLKKFLRDSSFTVMYTGGYGRGYFKFSGCCEVIFYIILKTRIAAT